ncbi:MAG: hypothetical protein EOO20_27785 [Chryseobacterium sp.]|nr:MAG: hypothetical protein EOO20_27785 [Chryseobacterium sp.]
MRAQNNFFQTSLGDALLDLRRLKRFASAIKQPPKNIADNNVERSPKKEEPQNDEAPDNSYVNLQAKYKNNQPAILGEAKLSDSEMIKILRRASILSFTARGITNLSVEFNISEDRVRNLISSVCREKYGR